MSNCYYSAEAQARKALIEYIYSPIFTSRFKRWLYDTRKKVAMTFIRKYKDPIARHEDIVEFIVSDKFQMLQITEPELFRIDVWIDRTFLYANLRSRFFTIYKNFTIDRWKRYKLIKNRELQILMEDNQIEETMANDANPDIVNALIYRQVWNQYTSTLNSTDKTIALFLLKGTITMPALEKAVGLKKSQIYIRLQKIENDIQDIMSKYLREA